MPDQLLGIRTRLSAYLIEKYITFDGVIIVKRGLTLKKFLKEADRSPAFKDQPCLQEIFRQPMPPTVLINGDPLPLPEGLNYRLAEGDEITVLTPLAGG